MNNKETLAVKYRPKDWQDLIEQEYIKTILENQIETNSIKNAYLFTGPAGCGKTTSARIFASRINEGQGNPIEVDAASNNGVEQIRVIIDDAKFKPLDSKYKIYIMDECVEGKTEILTYEGWKRIDSIRENEIVAQYTDEGKIEFVPIEEYIVKEYHGDMYKVSFRNGKKSVLMSPHHVQPVRIKNSQKIVENYIEDCKFAQTNEIIVSGEGTGNNELLTSIERLYLACQADGYCGHNNLWELHLSKPDKINRALDLLDDCQIKYKIYGEINCSIRFYYDFPQTKKLKDYFIIDMGIDRAKDFISEILLWDGSTKSGYPGYYSCTDKDNVDFVSAILAQCGYSGNQNITHYENPNHNDIYSINWYYTDSRPSTAVSKEKIECFNGNIYCVKVPSHKIVVRADGFTFISGNCHMLSNGAWNAMLKLLEEPPKTTIFILCTTDPQKIPKTILSRVQRYDFNKISFDGIVNRLKWIIDQENNNIFQKCCNDKPFEKADFQKDGIIEYEQESLEYLSKVSEGGMRDAISMLDKCLSYSNQLTVENVVKALGISDYESLNKLLEYILCDNDKGSIEIIENIYKQGKDLKLFIKQFIQFILDICKYYIYNSYEYIQIPNTIDLKYFLDFDYDKLLNILDEIIELSNQIKYEQNPKVLIESKILMLGKE